MNKLAPYRDEIQSMLDAGLRRSEIASKLKVHHQVIQRTINKYGLEIYVAFDEHERINTCVEDWLTNEDRLEEFLKPAYEENYLLIRDYTAQEDTDHVEMFRYVREKYGGLREYLKRKGLHRLHDCIFRRCRICEKIHPLKNFYKVGNSLVGFENRCKSCYFIHSYDKETSKAAVQRRRAFMKNLPAVWGVLDYRRIRRCALTGNNSDLAEDHVIPLAWGHGGTYTGNIVPLNKELNGNKRDNHVFHWFETNRQRFELDRTRFDRMISIVAAQNGLTPDEYRQYYDWCYANRRTLAKTKRDNAEYGYKRPSLELWREATGIPFPIRIDFEEKAEAKRRVRTRKESEGTA